MNQAARLEKVVLALGNDVRRQLLGILASGSYSVAGAAKVLGLPVQNVEYHVSVLNKCGLIEREAAKVRLRSRADFGALDIGDLPDGIQAAFELSFAEMFLGSLDRAIRFGATKASGTHVQAAPLSFDANGWQAAAKAVRETDRRLFRIEVESRKRLRADSGAERIQAMLGTALFRITRHECVN